VTIADLVADVRAATPSNAAEIVVPERGALVRDLRSLERRLSQALDNLVGGLRLRLERLLRPLYSARSAASPIRKRLVALQEQLGHIERANIRRRQEELAALRQRLGRHDPRSTLRRDRQALGAVGARLRDAGRLPIQQRRERLVALTVALQGRGRPLVREARASYAEACARLDALSPLRVLERGYAIALNEKTGRAIRSANEVKRGDRVSVRVSDGEFGAKVEDKR